MPRSLIVQRSLVGTRQVPSLLLWQSDHVQDNHLCRLPRQYREFSMMSQHLPDGWARLFGPFEFPLTTALDQIELESMLRLRYPYAEG